MAIQAQAPIPAAHLWDWQVEGSCRLLPSEMFFHPDGERGRARRMRIEQAKAVCETCPVLQACREHALTVREPYGIWGGMGEEERQRHYARADLGVA